MAKVTSKWSPPLDFLDLEPYQMDVWRICLNQPTVTVKQLESTLSADESQRAARFHFPEGKERYIIAHGCLRNILARYLHFEPAQLDFSIDGFGKPALNNNELEFNLSHSGDFALVAVTRERRVGVDVEHYRPDLEYEKIAQRYFSPNEVAELMALPPEQKIVGFFNCWTRKEAYIKAHGLGLSLPLDSFEVTLIPNETAILRATRPNPEEANHWTLVSLNVGFDYAGAIAVEDTSKGQNLEIRLWGWNQIIQ